MDSVRFTCPACRKEVEASRPEVARPRTGKEENDPLVLIRATCPGCGKVVQLSRLRERSDVAGTISGT
jgi:endogenous inhibitor of DNA gyrase (YacG/DUF329 family)